MLLENVSLGRTLEIFVEREGYRYRLISKVEDVDSKRVCVTLIAANGKIFAFNPEDSISIAYRDSDQMWKWEQVKAGIAKLGGELIHYFEITNLGSSYNRRNAFRVALEDNIELQFYLTGERGRKSSEIPMLEGDAKETKPALLKVKADLKDVSETGVGIFCSSDFRVDDSFMFSIPSTYGPLRAKATVVRIVEVRPGTHKYSNYYGCTFTESDQRIVKYIYEIQRSMLQKQREKKTNEGEVRSRIRASVGTTDIEKTEI